MPRTVALRLAVYAALMFFGSPQLAAAHPVPEGRIMIFDLRGLAADDAPETANRVFVIEATTACGGVPLPQLAAAQLAQCLDQQRSELVKAASERWIATKGGELTVHVLYDPSEINKVVVGYQETSRKLQIAEDIESLRGLMADPATLAAGPELIKSRYLLTKVRARLTVKVDAEALLPGDPTTAEGQAQPEELTLQGSLVTGPAENWFLSIDVPVTDVEKLELDKESGGLVPKETSTYYLGVDYQLGDVLSERWSGVDGLVFKILLTLSDDPLASAGLGVGYRLRSLRIGGVNIDRFSPFLGYVSTRQDELAVDGTATRGGDRTEDFVFGISLNLDRAVELIGK